MRMAFLKARAASSIIGIVAMMCAIPKATDIVDRYLQRGTVDAAAAELLVVPAIYLMAAYAERRT